MSLHSHLVDNVFTNNFIHEFFVVVFQFKYNDEGIYMRNMELKLTTSQG